MSWYYAVNGQQTGPVEEAELHRLALSGAVTASTLVWRAGMEAWAALGTVWAPEVAATETCRQCARLFAPDQTITMRGETVCAGCKPGVLQRLREGQAALGPVKPFAGFWIRLVARMIDNTITSIAGYVFQIPMLVIFAGMGKNGAEPNLAVAFGWMGFAVLMSLATAAYYEAWFLVKKGATPGKMILGLKVIRARGGEIGWKLALGRYFAHMLSAFTLYVGYMMAGWDEEKRALHDRVCDTRVVTGG